MATTSDFPVFELEDLKVADACWDKESLIAAVDRFDGFFVVDDASDEHMARIRGQLDTAWDGTGLLVINSIFAMGDLDNQQLTLLKGVLQLGADPDALDARGFAVSNGCSYFGWGGFADVISKCRPDVTMPQGTDQETPLRRALLLASSRDSPGFAEVADIWRKAERDGFPSLAHLAHDQAWYAVHNLCRRRVVRATEKNEPDRGKTALQWARFHGQDQLAEELVYLLEIQGEEGVKVGRDDEMKIACHQVAANMMDDSLETLKEKIKTLEAEKVALSEAVDQLGEELETQAGQLNFFKEELGKLQWKRKTDVEMLHAEIGELPERLSSMLPSLIESTVAAAFGTAGRNHVLTK